LAAFVSGAKRAWPATTVDALLRSQCAATPSALACSDGDTSLSYAVLARAADHIGAELAARGIGRGDVVGVLADRDVLLPALLLAVLERGAAYLPLDPEAPAQRLAQVLDDAGARAVLVRLSMEDEDTDARLTAFGGRVIDLAT